MINDAGISPGDGQAAVRIINGVTNSSPLAVSVVGQNSTGVASVGTSSEYVLFPAGAYDFLVVSGSSLIGKLSATIKSGATYSVVSYGAAGYFVTSNLLQD